jgi:hypothetical protein
LNYAVSFSHATSYIKIDRSTSNRSVFHQLRSSLLLGFLCIRDRVVQLYPPTSPYIQKSFEWILIYEIAGGVINKYSLPTPVILIGLVKYVGQNEFVT